MRRSAPCLSLCLLVVLAAGCSSPPAKFYTLSAAPVPASVPAGISVAVGPVSVPADVDRPEIVVSAGPNQVQLDDFNRWAAPLQDGIVRAVSENLVSMLGTSRVMSYATLPGTADFQVSIAVQSFVSAPGAAASLDAVWTVRRTKDGKTETGRTTVREPSPDKGYDALAAAHSRALARMSQDIAGAVKLLAAVPR